MNVLITGATGMIGSGVLTECLESSRVKNVSVLGRSTTGRQHPKLKEFSLPELDALATLNGQLGPLDACFFCLGVSAVGMKKDAYERITYDLTTRIAKQLLSRNPGMIFCYVSGEGTDSAEKSMQHWARVKGKTENALLEMPFKAAYMFRPGFVQPVKGAKTKTALYRAVYAVMAPLYPVWNAFFPQRLCTTETIGKAMIAVVAAGAPKRILHAADINILAEKLDALEGRRI